ncbi:MAG: hypothetical protein JO264_06065 [Acidisphaera sp.]|nr:hypothetical protein [Acidisphaera sp.]
MSQASPDDEHDRMQAAQIAGIEAILAQLPDDHVEVPFLQARLHAGRGDIDAAQRVLAAGIYRNFPVIAADRVLLEKALAALFLGRCFDLMSSLIAATHGQHILVDASDPQPDINLASVVRWQVAGDGATAFRFHDAIFRHGFMETLVQRWVSVLRLFLPHLQARDIPSGEVMLNLEDRGVLPGLAFCDNRPEFFLIPDATFAGLDGYAEVKRHFVDHGVPWEQRRPVAFWRGATTGWHTAAGTPVADWRELPRIKLCALAQAPVARELLDAAITGVVQIDDPQAAAEIERCGYLRPYAPNTDVQNYKFNIDIDGNTNSWPGLFSKLCAGSPVLKVQSAGGFRQWYYERLTPWENFVPVQADMSDLIEKVAWLACHDEIACQIGRNGAQLAYAMTVQSEALAVGPTIRAAFRWAGG